MSNDHTCRPVQFVAKIGSVTNEQAACVFLSTVVVANGGNVYLSLLPGCEEVSQ